MNLYKEILSTLLEKEEVQITFPNLQLAPAEMVEMESLKTLQKIKALIEDDSLSDFECMEEIVCVFEAVGSDGGNRHDFG